jgi:two-component system sensor histidine kinase/response regulator
VTRFKCLSVLLVEDNPINRKVARAILAEAGIRVTEAENGAAAVDRVGKAAFDAVIMDVQMPEMDGVSATREIRRRHGNDAPPIIAMTAHALPGDAEKFLSAGMSAYVPKPVDADRLLDVLARCVFGAAAAGSESPRPKITSADGHRHRPTPLPRKLPGVDVALGIQRVGGSERFYRSILRDFYARYADTARQVKSYLDSMNLAAAADEVHSLKGAAGSIAAMGLFEQAQRLESSLRQEGASRFEAQFAGLVERLTETLAAIRDLEGLP